MPGKHVKIYNKKSNTSTNIHVLQEQQKEHKYVVVLDGSIGETSFDWSKVVPQVSVIF